MERNELDEMGRLISELQEEVKRRGSELDQVSVDVRYIVEENGALQELVSRLVERIDELGALQAGARTPRDGGNGDAREGPGPKERPAPPGRILSSSALLDAKPVVRPWRPDDLGGPGVQGA